MAYGHSGIEHQSSKLILLIIFLGLSLTGCGGDKKKAEPIIEIPEEPKVELPDVPTGPIFKAVDFENKVYVSKKDNSVSIFSTDRTGIEYAEDTTTHLKTTKPFTWSIIDNKLQQIYNNSNTLRTLTLESNSDNKYTISQNTANEITPNILYQAKNFSLSGINGKIIALDTTSTPKCSVRTIKFEGNVLSVKELCTDGFFHRPATLDETTNLTNTLTTTFTDPDTNLPGSGLVVLIEGDINQTSTIVFLRKNQNLLSSITTETVSATTQEADPNNNPTPDAISVFAGRLILNSKAPQAMGESEVIHYGFTSNLGEPVLIHSLEAEMTLMDSQVTQNASANMTFYQHLKSKSTSSFTDIIISIQHTEAHGTRSRAYINTNGSQSAIEELNNKPLETGVTYPFKIERQYEGYVIHLAGYTAVLPKARFPFEDPFSKNVKFMTYVTGPRSGDFSKGSIDNITFTANKSGSLRTDIRNFNDGVTPVYDFVFNNIYINQPPNP